MKSYKQDFYEIVIGSVKSSMSYSEARCLWENIPRRKFSGVKGIGTYKQENVEKLLSSLSSKFNCSVHELIKKAIEIKFEQGFYKIERNHRNYMANLTS